MILDPAHQPITVRAWSQVLVWDTAVPMEEERGHWAGGQRAMEGSLRGESGTQPCPQGRELGANGVHPGRSEVSVEEHRLSVSAREHPPSLDQSSQTPGFSLDLLVFSVSAAPTVTKGECGQSQQNVISSLKQLRF